MANYSFTAQSDCLLKTSLAEVPLSTSHTPLQEQLSTAKHQSIKITTTQQSAVMAYTPSHSHQITADPTVTNTRVTAQQSSTPTVTNYTTIRIQQSLTPSPMSNVTMVTGFGLSKHNPGLYVGVTLPVITLVVVSVSVLLCCVAVKKRSYLQTQTGKNSYTYTCNN